MMGAGAPPPDGMPPGAPGPRPVYSGRSLGLGLGLNPAQREAFRSASAAGNLSGFAETLRPGQQEHMTRLLSGRAGDMGQQHRAQEYEAGMTGGRDMATDQTRIAREREAAVAAPTAGTENLARLSMRPGLYRGATPYAGPRLARAAQRMPNRGLYR